MIHSYDFRLPFLDTDANRELTVTGALDLMQDAADSHTISVVDPDYLASSHRIWVLNSWLVYFDKPCHGRDILKMSTWSAGLNRIFASRFFTIADSAGDTCVRARTFWFLVDDRTMRPVRPTEEDIGYYIPSPALDLEDPGRKISVPDHLEQAEPGVEGLLAQELGVHTHDPLGAGAVTERIELVLICNVQSVCLSPSAPGARDLRYYQSAARAACISYAKSPTDEEGEHAYCHHPQSA
jgi:acyl-CoA thioesterase FadM